MARWWSRALVDATRSDAQRRRRHVAQESFYDARSEASEERGWRGALGQPRTW